MAQRGTYDVNYSGSNPHWAIAKAVTWRAFEDYADELELVWGGVGTSPLRRAVNCCLDDIDEMEKAIQNGVPRGKQCGAQKS